MKKIFTFMMLSILTMMNVNAEEQTLWEGDVTLSYGGWQPDAQEPAFLTQADFAAFEVGQKLHFYLTPEEADGGHLCRFTDWGRTENSLGIADKWLWYEANKVHDVVLEVSEGVKTAVAANGFAICGNKLHLIKVTKEVASSGQTINDIDAAVLWQGEQTLQNWSGETGVKVNFEQKGITTACNLYLLISNYTSGNLRLTRNSGWVEYPSDNYDHLQNVDADNVVKISLSQDFVDGVVASEYKEIVIWGNNVTVKAIGTTKASVMGTTGLKAVSATDNKTEGWWTMGGQQQNSKPSQRGLYIYKGKKYIIQ